MADSADTTVAPADIDARNLDHLDAYSSAVRRVLHMIDLMVRDATLLTAKADRSHESLLWGMGVVETMIEWMEEELQAASDFGKDAQ